MTLIKKMHKIQKNRSDRGAALMVVLGLSIIIAVILHRTLFLSQVEYLSSRNTIDELRAGYNARSGAELNLLRIMIFKEVQRAVEGNRQAILFKPYMDFIWKWPLFWPLPIPEDLTKSDKQSLRTLKKKSFLKGSYFTEILSEDGKIGLNGLISPIDYLRTFTEETLINLLLNEAEQEKLELDISQVTDILSHLADGMDKDNESRQGGIEKSTVPGQSPFNRSFVFREEIQNVTGLTESIYNILKTHISTYSINGLNINYTKKPLLQAIGLSEELVATVLSRTQVGSPDYKPFADIKEFCHFLSNQGSDLCSFLEGKYGTVKMLKFHTPTNFLIRSRGRMHRAFRQSELLVYDANLSLKQYRETVQIQENINQGKQETISSEDSESGDTGPQADSKDKTDKSKKKDTEKTQYLSFSPLFIMYWKED